MLGAWENSNRADSLVDIWRPPSQSLLAASHLPYFLGVLGKAMRSLPLSLMLLTSDCVHTLPSSTAIPKPSNLPYLLAYLNRNRDTLDDKQQQPEEGASGRRMGCLFACRVKRGHLLVSCTVWRARGARREIEVNVRT